MDEPESGNEADPHELEATTGILPTRRPCCGGHIDLRSSVIVAPRSRDSSQSARDYANICVPNVCIAKSCAQARVTACPLKACRPQRPRLIIGEHQSPADLFDLLADWRSAKNVQLGRRHYGGRRCELTLTWRANSCKAVRVQGVSAWDQYQPQTGAKEVARSLLQHNFQSSVSA